MKKLVKKLALLLAIVLAVATAGVITILKCIDRVYDTEYPRVLTVKYDYMMQLASPKIICVGDSNLAFGLDGEMLTALTGYPTANLGLHVGYGQKFMIHLAKADAKPGDIIVISLSPDRWASNMFFGGQLTLASIGSRIDMYRYVPSEYWMQMFRELQPAAVSMLRRSSPYFNGAGDYKRAMFDNNGNNLLEREECILADPYTPDVLFSADTLNHELVDYVNAFAREMEQNQVSVVVSFSPILDASIVGTKEDCMLFEAALKSRLQVPVISRFDDYVYPRAYIYDFAFHCNKVGEGIRTRQLANDIAEHIGVDDKAADSRAEDKP